MGILERLDPASCDLLNSKLIDRDTKAQQKNCLIPCLWRTNQVSNHHIRSTTHLLGKRLWSWSC